MADVNEMRQKFFANKRQDIDMDANRQDQKNQDVIQRRFSAIGQAGSGAQIGAQLNSNRDIAEAKQKATNDLSGQELQSQMQQQEVADNRAFASGEAEKQRGFAAGEAGLGRTFQGGLADKDAALKQKFFDTEQGNKLKEMDLAERQFALDKDTTLFNQRMAEIESGKKPAGMLDSLGTPGTVGRGAVDLQSTISSGGLNLIPQIGNIFGGGGGGCFLTTAATEVMGMADDCWVLKEARKFRDGYMTENAERAEQILEYYEIAPKVVDGINKLSDAKKVWKHLFWHGIIPFVDAVRKNELEIAHERYLNLIERAKARSVVQAEV